MELLSNLALGFSVSLQPLNVLLAFVGVVLGVVIGILPGLGSRRLSRCYCRSLISSTPQLPSSCWREFGTGRCMAVQLLQFFCVFQANFASVMVAIDGYELTKQGRAGAALGMSMFSAFIAGMVGLVGLGLVAPTLAEFALEFGPPEYFALTLLGLTLSVILLRI